MESAAQKGKDGPELGFERADMIDLDEKFSDDDDAVRQ